MDNFNPNYQPQNEQPTYQQPAYEQPVYQQPIYNQPVLPDPSSIFTKGLLSLILGYFIPLVGIILGAMGRKAAKQYINAGVALTGKAKVGSILSLIGMILGIVGVVAVVFLVIYYIFLFVVLAASGY